jgi:Flp pilus assembly protein TadD
MPRVAARALLAVLALLAGGWLAVGWRNARLQDRARTILVQERIAPADADDAARWLRRASFLNPDSTPEISLGLLALRTGRPREAERRAREVLGDEPERSEARNLLLAARQRTD